MTVADGPSPVTALLAWALSVGTQAQLVKLYDIQALGVHGWEMPLERFLYYSKVMPVQFRGDGCLVGTAQFPRGHVLF